MVLAFLSNSVFHMSVKNQFVLFLRGKAVNKADQNLVVPPNPHGAINVYRNQNGFRWSYACLAADRQIAGEVIAWHIHGEFQIIPYNQKTDQSNDEQNADSYKSNSCFSHITFSGSGQRSSNPVQNLLASLFIKTAVKHPRRAPAKTSGGQ